MKEILINSSLSVLTVIMLAGCNHSDSPKDNMVTKVFVDAPVEGLAYSCAGGEEQLTNDVGEFTCNEGDTVTFSIGNVVLGSLVTASSAATELSPYNLSDNLEEVINIAQFIQSCDDDGVLLPTIVIDPSKAELFDNSTITIGSPTFDADTNATLGGTLVSNEDAEAHLIQNVPDITAPVVTLNGDDTISVLEGTTYTDEGATAEDNKDGVLTPVKSGTVDTAIPADYNITWTATDEAGNVGTAVRTVTVVADLPPVVTLIGPSTVSIVEGDTYVDEGATAEDNEDGVLTPVKSGTVDTTTPGTYTITWTATDSGGKTGTADRTVTVTEYVDTIAPVVTLLGDASVTQSFGNYVDAGATAEDDIDGDVTSSIVVSPLLDTESDAGTYTVTYTATDAAGNEGTATRTVTINACVNFNPITGGCEDSPL